jgi:dopamine beta-monooxygenase
LFQPIEYPPEAGTEFGGPDFYPYFMVEVHYNNPAMMAGIRDKSGNFLVF